VRARAAGIGPVGVGVGVGVAVVSAVALLAPAVALAHGAFPDDPPSLLGVLTTWTFDPVVLLPFVLSLGIWFALVRRIDRSHPDSPVPKVRTYAFLGGLVALALALMSGVEEYDTTLFAVHMIQHMLIVFVAAPLIALSAPVTQLLRASTPAVRRRWILPILHSRVLRVISHPVVAWILFAGVMWISHFSPLFEWALEDPGIHEIEHVLFLVSALLFWWPVVALDPAPYRLGPPARIMYVFLQMPQNSFLAMALLFAEDPLYPHYVTLGAPYGIDALADQKLAAGFMWFFGDLLFLGVLIALVALWMRREERDTEAAERRVDVEREAIRARAAALAERRGVDAVAMRVGEGLAGGAPAVEGPAGAGRERDMPAGEGVDAAYAPGSGEASSSR
jgi:putative copper resistance protein D